MLGAALLGQKKYAEAESMLLQGYQGMKARATQIPEQARNDRLIDGLDRLIAFCEATGKPGEAAKWRKELQAVDRAPKPKK